MEIIITGREDLDTIRQLLLDMPMTRRYGKYIIARLPNQDVEKPTALCLRVSSAQQAEKDKGSLSEQFLTTWDEAERRGGTVVAVYIDVVSADNRERRAWAALLEDIEAGNLEMLGAWHSSRVLRSQKAAGELEEAMARLSPKLEMFSIKDVLDAELLGILAWAGGWEKKAFKERSLMGRQAAAADNRPPSGTPPFWLEVERNEEGKPLKIKLKSGGEWDKTIEALRWAATAYADGTGSTAIVRQLNLWGIRRPTGQTKYGWTRQFLAQILKYSALKGKWGPFWGDYIDVPALIDEATWDRIQERLKENGSHSGRPAQHFVALRRMLRCSVCGQKMGTHVRDWDYTYKKLADGTRARYRIQKRELKIRYVCNGQQHYGLKCRQPEYVKDKVLFPRVWERLCEALNQRDILLAGLDSRLVALKNSNELEEMRRLESRLERLRQRELSYSEQRAEGTLSKALHQEQVLRLNAERSEIAQAIAQLKQQVQLIEEAREQTHTAHKLIEALPEVLTSLTRAEQERLVMALISQIDVDGENQVTIYLRLDPDVLNGLHLPKSQSASSPQHESEPKGGSPSGESDSSKAAPARRHKANGVGCTHNMDYRRG